MGGTLHTIFTLLVKIIAIVTLSNLKQVLTEVKRGCPTLFGL